DCVKPDRDLPFEMLGNCSTAKSQHLSALHIVGTVVVVPSAFTMWPSRLHSVRPAIHKQPTIIFNEIWADDILYHTSLPTSAFKPELNASQLARSSIRLRPSVTEML